MAILQSDILSGQASPAGSAKPKNLGEAVQGATGGNGSRSWSGGQPATSAANAPRTAAAGPTPPASANGAAKPATQPAVIAKKVREN